MEYLHRHAGWSRKGFLALGASGLATAAANALGPAAALAAPQPPAPQGDDLGFLTFGAVAEGAARVFYRTALATPGLFDAGERRRLAQARATKREHIIRLSAAMTGKPVARGLPNPMSTDDAGAALDKLITVPGSPGGR